MSEIDLIRKFEELKQIVENLVKPEVGRVVDWTPTVTQGAAITISITYAKYIISNGIAILTADIAVTSAGTAANEITIGGIPSVAQFANYSATALYNIGGATIFDSGTEYIHAACSPKTASTMVFVRDGAVSRLGVSSYTLANGDNISFTATYEQG